MMYHRKKEKGFVILFTVLVASIILAIALGIASVSYREILLSGTARDAGYSFFAADTGAECALYWDIQQAAFAQTLVVPSCRGASVDMISSSSPYQFRFDTAQAGCAVVTVDKNDPAITKIESLGYNVSCQNLSASQSTPNPRIVERAIRVTYAQGQAPDTNASTGSDQTSGDVTTRGEASATTSDTSVRQ